MDENIAADKCLWHARISDGLRDSILQFLQYKFGVPKRVSELGLVYYSFSFADRLVAQVCIVLECESTWVNVLKAFNSELFDILSADFELIITPKNN